MHTLVIIDDEYIVVEGIKAIITQQHIDYSVAGFAYNGIDGQKLIYEKRPDVVITDIRMPGMDGLSLIESCREFLPSADYIIISGYTEFEYARRALTLGVSNYLDKPVTIRKLTDAINKINKKTGRLVKDGKLCEAEERVIDAAVTEDPGLMTESFEVMLSRYKKIYTEPDEFRQEIFKILAAVTEIINEKLPSPKALHAGYAEIEKYTDIEVEQYARKIISQIATVLIGKSYGNPHQLVSQVIRIIAEKYNTDIGLNEIADMVRLNPAYLCMLFRENVGISYVKYLTDVRVKKACELLHSGYQISQVSSMVGYHDYHYFSYIFKKQTGMTPNEYKGHIRKKQ